MQNLRIRNLEDVIAIERTPLTEHLQDQQTTYSIISKAAEKYADRQALVFLPLGNPLADLNQSVTKSIYTYRELLTGVNQTANMLLSLGAAKGDVISYILPNCIENYFSLYAAQAVGIANPISPVLPAEHILELLQTADSKILITMGEHINPDLWQNLLTIRQHCPKLEKIIVLGGAANPEQQIFDFHQLLTQQPTQLQFDPTQIRPESVCSYFHTSGTTRTPKLAAHTHFGNAYMAWAMSIVTEYDQADLVVLSGLPMFHVGAPMVSGLAAFRHGGKVVVMSPMGWMDPLVVENFWKITEKYQGTTTTALPFIYKALTHTPLDGANISSLRQAISGTAVCAHDFKLFKQKTGVKIANLWGQTEVTSISTFNPAVDPEDKHFGNMGVRLPFQQMKVVKLTHQGQYIRDCTTGEAGVLCVRGPNVIGYKKPELNHNAFVDGDWLNAGDWVRQEADGYFVILGRTEDFIQRADQLISLLEIEQLVSEHPMIAEVAAISVLDSRQEAEIPILYSVLKPEANLTAEQLLTWLRTQWTLAAEAFPAQVILQQHLPKNGMGKPLKYVLREQFVQTQTALV